jgi:hypothetical protein
VIARWEAAASHIGDREVALQKYAKFEIEAYACCSGFVRIASVDAVLWLNQRFRCISRGID